MKAEEIERQFADGESILSPGAVVPELFIVRSGEVRITFERGADRVLTQGQVFGERGAFLARPSRVQAIARGEVCVLALDVGLLERLCGECPEFNVRLIRSLAGADDGDTAEDVSATPPGFAALCAALLELRASKDPPAPVDGRLLDIAARAGIHPRDAYAGIQILLERRVLRLVDDQLSVVEPEQLA